MDLTITPIQNFEIIQGQVINWTLVRTTKNPATGITSYVNLSAYASMHMQVRTSTGTLVLDIVSSAITPAVGVPSGTLTYITDPATPPDGTVTFAVPSSATAQITAGTYNYDFKAILAGGTNAEYWFRGVFTVIAEVTQ